MLTEGLRKEHGQNYESSIKILRLHVVKWDTRKGPEQRRVKTKAVFEEEDSMGLWGEAGGGAGTERLVFAGPVWTRRQGSRREEVRNQCGYSDKWGFLACIDYSFGYKSINGNKEIVQVSFS